MIEQHRTALNELSVVLDAMDVESVETACNMICDSNEILLYGCGREALQMRGLAMRLYHLGCKAGMVVDMNAPPLRNGDLFVASAGPGELSTVSALMQVAKRDGARILFLTAVADAQATAIADHTLVIPAQTMATDMEATQSAEHDAGTTNQLSVLPMGSIYEGVMFVLFEMMVLKIQTLLDVKTQDMRARHTNME